MEQNLKVIECTDIINVIKINELIFGTFKYHVFAPMGRFQLELIYLYFPPSFHLIVGCFCPGHKQPTVRWKDSGK